MQTTIESLLKDAKGLISLPEVAIRVNAMVNDQKASTSDIGRVIQQDPALTARLLKIANSPLYGFAAQIDTVSRAVTVLGLKEIRDLVLATSAIQAFNVKPGLESFDALWSHNIYCAIAARELAVRCKSGHVESMFISGLLHDIGRMLFITLLPEAMTNVQARINGRAEHGLCAAEREVIGFDHAEAGGELVKQWGLPEGLEACVRYHHSPAQAEAGHTLEVAIVHLADALAHVAQQDNLALEAMVADIDPQVWVTTGLSLDDLDAPLEKVRQLFKETRLLLTGRG